MAIKRKGLRTWFMSIAVVTAFGSAHASDVAVPTKISDRLAPSAGASCTPSRGGVMCVNHLSEERTFVIADPENAVTTLIRMPKSDPVSIGDTPTASKQGVVQ